jgi:hypothetical protein
MMGSLAIWIKGTPISWFVNHYAWVWPTCETLHFIGLTFLIGTVGVLDMRILGIAKELEIAAMHRLIRWGIGGFIINLVTGILFFFGQPDGYIGNIAFYLKMLFVVLAGVNVTIFYLTVYEEVEKLAPGGDAPFAAKVIAAVSLFFWVGVIFFGRMLPFLGNSF